MTLIEELHNVIARLQESREIENQAKQIAKEMALEQKALHEARTEKQKLGEELQQLRADVALEQRNLAHFRGEMAKLRKSLEIPRAA